jgi:hypothetical protein
MSVFHIGVFFFSLRRLSITAALPIHFLKNLPATTFDKPPVRTYPGCI